MLEYQKPTNQVHEIKLTSKIIHAFWNMERVAVGKKAVFEVGTQFVGDGSEIEIKIKDKSGKTIDKIKDKVYGNQCKGVVVVPKDAKEELTYIAKLSKHKLEMQSTPIKVVPAVVIKNLKWGQKEARRGDMVKITADTFNIPDEMEVKISIYEDDVDNANELITEFPLKVKKNKVETEWEYEYHGGTYDIPMDEELKPAGRKYKHPEYFFMVRYAGAEEKSDLLKFKDWMEFELKNDDGEPAANEKYVVTFADGSKKEGRLDKNGRAKIEDIPPGWVDIDYPDFCL